MVKKNGRSTQGGKTARMPATKFAHLQKKAMKKKAAGIGKPAKRTK